MLEPVALRVHKSGVVGSFFIQPRTRFHSTYMDSGRITFRPNLFVTEQRALVQADHKGGILRHDRRIFVYNTVLYEILRVRAERHQRLERRGFYFTSGTVLRGFLSEIFFSSSRIFLPFNRAFTSSPDKVSYSIKPLAKISNSFLF